MPGNRYDPTTPETNVLPDASTSRSVKRSKRPPPMVNSEATTYCELAVDASNEIRLAKANATARATTRILPASAIRTGPPLLHAAERGRFEKAGQKRSAPLRL